MRLKTNRILFLPVIAMLLAVVFGSCNVYRFRDVSIPPEVNTFKVYFIENKATYINPQISPQLTDQLRQKIATQTRLKQTNGDADWEITATITDYSFSTSGISNQQSVTNRINVTVQIELNDLVKGVVTPLSVSRNFDFPSTQSIQQAEVALLNDIIKGLSDDIFNRLFSNW